MGSTFLRTPSQGLKILEKLYQNNPYHQGVINSLINAYIRLGEHNKAINMIANILDNKTDVQSLKFKAWVGHKKGNIEKERRIWDIILDKNYLVQVHNKINTLLLRSHKKIEIKRSDIPLFSIVRNEMTRLPFFLEYYRNLGVTQFIFIDNNSDDGSFDYLLEQKDCYVYWTNDSYLESGHGLTWLNYLINETSILRAKQWYIIADADEFLVYPSCEKIKLNKLIRYLNQSDSESVPSFMLDMYANNLNFTEADFGGDLISNYPYFYHNYYEYHQSESPYTIKSGGIRQLLFNEHNLYFVKTALFKKINTKNILMSSTHQTTPTKTSDITSAFLHFKFIKGFDKISKTEMKRKQHSGGASRYRIYANNINNIYNLEEIEKTTKYQNSQQLVDLGLIQCPDDWKGFIKNEENDES